MIFGKKSIALLLVAALLFFSGCVSEQLQNATNQSEKKANIELAYLTQQDFFPADTKVMNSQNELDYELRRCDFEQAISMLEKPLLFEFGRPVISIHANNSETPARDAIFAGVAVNDKNFVETLFAPLIILTLQNTGDANSGEIKLSFEEQSNGEIFFVNAEQFSFGAGYKKRFPNELPHDYYLIGNTNNYIRFDANTLPDDIVLLCDDESIPKTTFLGNTFSCKKSFKQIMISSLEPNEMAEFSFLYFPMQRLSFESQYPMNPSYYWTTKDNANEKTEIKINMDYNGNKKELLKINLHHSLDEFIFDSSEDYCIPK